MLFRDLFSTPLLHSVRYRYNDAKLANEWLPHPLEAKDHEKDAFTLGFVWFKPNFPPNTLPTMLDGAIEPMLMMLHQAPANGTRRKSVHFIQCTTRVSR